MKKHQQKFTVLIFGIFLFTVAILSTTTFAQNYEGSPFGAHGAFSRPFIESDKVNEEVLQRTHEEKELYRHVRDIAI